MLGKVLKNTSTLSQIHAYDKKNITFEILGEEEQQKEDELLTYVRLFKPSDWSLSPLSEIYVNRDLTLGQLAEQISEMYGIPKENVQCQKISSNYNYCRGDLRTEIFYDITRGCLENSRV